MRIKDLAEAKKQEPIKARDPNWRDMEALRKSGAAGSHGDKTKTIPRKEKYKKISIEDQFQAYMDEAKEPGEYRTISGVRYYIVKNKSGKSKAFSGPTPAAKKYAQTGGNWYDEDVNEADPDTLGKMNPKMRDMLSKVDADDKAQAQAAKDRAEAERQAKIKELGPKAMDEYIAKLKAHDWSYDYSDDHSVWQRGVAERDAIRNLQKVIDPDFEVYNKYAPDGYKVKVTRESTQELSSKKESSDIFKALNQVDESVTTTSSSDVGIVVSPHIAIGDKKTRKKYGLTGGLPNPPKAKMQDPKDNALNMKGTSIFGGPLKRS